MPSVQRDYYETLGVDKKADAEEIKRAYRRLAMKHHPDRNPGDAAAEGKFKEAAAAYEVLSDDQKRKIYDQHGHAGLKGAGATAQHDFSRMNVDDIFSMFNDIFAGGGGGGGGNPFGGMNGGGGRRGHGQARGYDLEHETIISLEDAFKGVEKNVEFTRLDVCEKCTGSGAKAGSKPITCATCGGQGRVQQSGLGGMFRMVTACPACGGRGQIIKEFCPDCRGKGRTPKKRSLSVRIPPGISDGQVVRVRGEGEPPPPEESRDGSGVRGDLHVVVRVKKHDLYEREGEHLVLHMPVSFTKAVLGAEVEVPTIDGGREKLTIPRGTQHGAMFRIGGKGMPDLRGGRRGDMAVVVRLEIPKKLNSAQEKLLREYAASENENVMPETQSFWKKIKDVLG
ncbi:MAG: molecular chaperone DnaJ [Phycisphaerales bacterium]